jgi:uncharacterized ferritin-like protein (DUF455 family)
MTGTLDPRLFAEGPAREEHLVIKELWAEMTNLPEGHPDVTREFLHRQMNEEINGLEISSRNLVDFPDADWELRMAIARQCSDEARHFEMFRRCLEQRGGRFGEYPILNFQYRIVMRIDSLVGRLAVQNRSFEAAGIDAIQHGVETSRESGEADLTALFDAQLADEVQHVRYANVWVKRLTKRDGPRAILALARAVSQVTEAFRIVAGPGVTAYSVAEDIRREAGFGDDEIQAAKDLASSM